MFLAIVRLSRQSEQGRQIKALAAHDRADPSGNTRCAVSLPKDAQYSECNKRLKG
jgi:hypothetical protein